MQILSVPKPTYHNDLNSDSSPGRSDDDEKYASAIVAVESYYSPFTSPLPITPPNYNPDPNPNPNLDFFSSIIPYNPPPPPLLQPPVIDRKGTTTSVAYGGGGGGREKVVVIEKVNLGARVMEFVFCLISFSVLAADNTQGWSGNSFHRYSEYRFCLSVNVLGFLYAAFQAFDAGNHYATGKHIISHHLRYQFDFIMDQVLAYLLMSASSAAASRVDDWQSKWGKDEFTNKASASVSMAFLAFLGFAMTSLISGYKLFNRESS